MYSFRGNQILASTYLFLITSYIYVSRNKPQQKSFNLMITHLVYFFPALLISLHNFWYGNSLFPIQTSVSSSFIINPLSILNVPFSDNLSQLLREQVGGVFVINSIIRDKIGGDLILFSFTSHVVIVLFLVSLCTIYFSTNNHLKISRMLHLLPFFFLVPHFFVQVYVTYPRHIVAGYLSMIVVIYLHLSHHRILLSRNGAKDVDFVP